MRFASVSVIAPSDGTKARALFIDTYHRLLEGANFDIPPDYDDALEEQVESLAFELASILADEHGPVLDFALLCRPFAYLFSFVHANAASRPPIDTPPEPGVAFPHLHAMTREAFDGFVHRTLFDASRHSSPLQRLVRATEAIRDASPAEAGPPSIDDGPPTGGGRHDPALVEVGASRGKGIGLSYSLPVLERWRLQSRLRGHRVKFLKFSRSNQPATYDPPRRIRLLKRLGQAFVEPRTPNRFETLLASALPFLPTYFLEDFFFHFHRARQQLKGIDVLFMGPEFHAKAGVAVAAALLKSHGGRVIGSQHGGSYGQTDPTWLERAEYAQADLYGTWGYRKCAKDRPLPSAHLSRRRVLWGLRQALGRARTRRNEVLVVLPFISRGLYYSTLSPPVTRQQEALGRSLAIVAALRHADVGLTLRPHPRNHADEYRDVAMRTLGSRWDVQIGQRGTLPIDATRFAAVVFLTPDATGLAELAAADMPFLIAACPKDFHFQPHATACYRALRMAGVWLAEPAVDSDQARAALSWTPDKQAAVKEFKARFALHDRHFLDHWAAFLQSV